MKVCHICEKIVKVMRSITCTDCKRSYCYPCISKYFGQRAKNLLPNTEADTHVKSKIHQCFYCLKECVCDKCRPRKDAKDQNELGKLSSFVKDQGIITQNGFFKGKKFNQMPGFMQRAYLKKKVLYSKHEVSMPSMISIAQAEQMIDERLQEAEKKSEKKGGLSQQIDDSLNPNQGGYFQVSVKNQMDIENLNQNEDQAISENEQEERQNSAEQNQNIDSSQYDANEIAQQNQQRSQQNASQIEAEQEDSSNKNESNQQPKRNRQKQVEQVLQNLQNESSIELVSEE